MTAKHLEAAFEQLILPVRTPRAVIEMAMMGQSIAHTKAVIDPCSGTGAFAAAAAEQVQPPIKTEKGDV